MTSATASPAGRSATQRLPPAVRSPGILPVSLLFTAIFFLGFISEIRGGLNGDSAWLLHVAGRVVGGAQLYADVIEVNPPLVVWFSLIIVGVARLLHVGEIVTYQVFVWGLVGLSLWYSDRMLAALRDPDDSRYRWGLLLGAAAVLLALPGPYFGQREHLTLALVLPWIVTTAARAEGRTPDTADAIATGLLAGLGIALKPHYVLLALGLVCFSWYRSPDRRLRLPPEHAALGAVVVTYALLALVLAPGYLALMARLGSVYWKYGLRALGTMLGATIPPLTVLGALALWPVVRRLTRYPSLTDALGIATATLFAAVILQHKGFGYHYYPAIGAGLLLLLLGLLGGSARPLARPVRLALAGLCLLVALPYTVLYLETALGRAAGSRHRSPVAAGSRELAAFVRTHEPRGSIVVYSPWMEDSFPWVLETRTEWGSRYPFMWFVPALYRKALASGEPLHYRSEREMRPEDRSLIRSVADDLNRFHPAYVFVRRPAGSGFLRLDILAAFQQDAEFRKAFGAYRPGMELEHFRVFRRQVEGRRAP